MHDFSEVSRGWVVGLFLQMHDFSEVGRKLLIDLFLQMHDFSEVEMILEYHAFYKYLIISD